MRRSACLPLLLILLPAALSAQVTTGSLTAGASLRGSPLGGVNVLISSPSLQGERQAVTDSSGLVSFPVLPPGVYTLTFTMRDMEPATETVRVGLGRSESVTVDMQMSDSEREQLSVIEEIVVVAKRNQHAPLDGILANIEASLVDELPLDRSLESAISLAPNVHFTGPGAAITISGALPAENLYMVNGAVINDSVSGTALPLYIEDAVQETTITTGALSAEYGRFSGGVVNAITKSGGDDFSATLRTYLTNDSWRETTPMGEEKAGGTTPLYEGTFGGPIRREKLWFFTAGRLAEPKEARQTRYTNIPYDYINDETRVEGKLTWSPTDSHTLTAAYLLRERDISNDRPWWIDVMDLASLSNTAISEDLVSLHYAGALLYTLNLQALYSARHLTIDQAGSTTVDLVDGTFFRDDNRGATFGAPFYCSVCSEKPETRDNEALQLKGSWFLSTDRLGSHEIVGGVESFSDMRLYNNYQSGSGYNMWTPASIVRGQQIFPVMTPFQTAISYTPVLVKSQGNEQKTLSAFVNDRVQVTSRLSLNLGLRYDRNDGTDSVGATVANDDFLSPRLGVTFDPTGDGRWTVSGGFATYVTSINNRVGDAASAGGQSAYFIYLYIGPPINGDPNAPTEELVPTRDAIVRIFDWFFANNAPLVRVVAPGLDSRIEGSLVSPHVNEWTLGLSRRLGSSGVLRLDAMHRDYRDFYAERTDLTTGQLTTEYGTIDLRVIENSNDVERTYSALSLQGSGRLTENLDFGGVWTVSKAAGNFEGFGDTGPVQPSDLGAYPEYKRSSWNAPTGALSIDRRHRARLWMRYGTPLSPRFGRLDVSLLETYLSGSPYGALISLNPSPYVDNPGYATPIAIVDYYFTNRDAFRADDVTSTDLALTYSYPLSGGVELFLQAHVLNLFDESAIANAEYVNKRVLTKMTSPDLLAFDPFNETPIRGVHWDLDPGFGLPTSYLAYQTPRTYRLSVSVRY